VTLVYTVLVIAHDESLLMVWCINLWSIWHLEHSEWHCGSLDITIYVGITDDKEFQIHMWGHTTFHGNQSTGFKVISRQMHEHIRTCF